MNSIASGVIALAVAVPAAGAGAPKQAVNARNARPPQQHALSKQLRITLTASMAGQVSVKTRALDLATLQKSDFGD